MTHPVDPEAVDALEEWLRKGLPAKAVTHRGNDGEFDKETYLFTALGHEGERFELEVSYEAFEKNSVDVIIADLDHRRALELLRQDPKVRLFYSSRK